MDLPAAEEGQGDHAVHPHSSPPARLCGEGTSVHVADVSTGGGLALLAKFDENAHGRQCPAVRAST